jgi:hypothetical protein
MDKIKNNGLMLLDIDDGDPSKLLIIASIYREFNKSMSKSNKSINRNDNSMLIYTALMYDKNSPIKKEPIDERKKLALSTAGFKSSKGMEDAVGLKDDRAIAIVHYYVKYQSDRNWAAYVALEQNFWANNLKIFSGGGDAKEQETVNKLSAANTTVIMPQLDKLENQIFGDNTEKSKQIINFCLEDFVEAIELAKKNV